MKPLRKIPLEMSDYEAHVDKWKDCTRCDFHKNREYSEEGKELMSKYNLKPRKGQEEGLGRVVFPGGDNPCDILFIGEAPGSNENQKGVPFLSPGGILLKDVVRKGLGETTWPNGNPIRIGYTYLLGCIPTHSLRKTDYPFVHSKVTEYSGNQITICRPKLSEIFHIMKPKMVVRVGEWPKKSIPGETSLYPSMDSEYYHGEGLPWLNGKFLLLPEMKHPVTFKRQENVANYSLEIQRLEIKVSDFVMDMIEAFPEGGDY